METGEFKVHKSPEVADTWVAEVQIPIQTLGTGWGYVSVKSTSTNHFSSCLTPKKTYKVLSWKKCKE